MYVTRPLSLLRRSPELLSSPPPEGPNSGILVIEDEESTPTCCFGLTKACCTIVDLPFPQNKLLNVHFQAGEVVLCDDVYLIPILDKPISSNRYYAIKPHGKHKGEALTCSKEGDLASLLCFSFAKDAKPRPLDPNDVYQQFEIFQYDKCLPCTTLACFNRFSTRSVASDGYPPRFLRRCGWNMFSKEPKNFSLGEASGVNTDLRAQLPDFSFLVSQQTSEPPVDVGKWYTPFMFVREGGEVKDQMKRSMYYEIKLDQRWERIFTCENILGNKYAELDVVVPTQVVRIEGKKEGVMDEKDGFVWFNSVVSDIKNESTPVGLSSLIVERMLWEEERVGFGRKEKEERVFRKEEYPGEGGWLRFGCYVLVERFAVVRMDGSLLLTCDFNHTHRIRTKWE